MAPPGTKDHRGSYTVNVFLAEKQGLESYLREKGF